MPERLVIPGAFDGVTIEPHGNTPGGLPYPEDTDPVMAGAQAIKALAQATESMISGNAGADPLTLYQQFQTLAGNPAYPAARWPFAYTVDPAIADNEAGATNDQRGVAFMVRRQVSCSAMAYFITTAATGSMNSPGFIGGTLYYYDGAATWKFMANTGASKPGSFGNSTGWKVLSWRNSGDTADTPQTLTPGIVYVAALTMAGWSTSNPRISVSFGGISNTNNFMAAGGFHRSAIRTGVTSIQTADVLTAARATNGHIPHYALL